jgi:hypothetical protein
MNRIPYVPILAGLATLIGGGTLAWYYSLGEADRQQADTLAEHYASELYGLAVDQLSDAQAQQVKVMVRRHYAN